MKIYIDCLTYKFKSILISDIYIYIKKIKDGDNIKKMVKMSDNLW